MGAKLPPQISADDFLAPEEGEEDAPEDEALDGDASQRSERNDRALNLAETLENTEAFAHMRVNRSKLMKSIVSLLKKNSAPGVVEQQVMNGLAKWTSVWRGDDWRYAPGRITDWLYDGKYLEEPRKKDAAAETDYGEVGVKEIV